MSKLRMPHLTGGAGDLVQLKPCMEFKSFALVCIIIISRGGCPRMRAAAIIQNHEDLPELLL